MVVKAANEDEVGREGKEMDGDKEESAQKQTSLRFGYIALYFLL